jgi:hypothetical protein
VAGGVKAQMVPCMVCGERADRIAEGIEDDIYQCEQGHKFGLDWGRGPPGKPLWPLSPDERKRMDLILQRRNEPKKR